MFNASSDFKTMSASTERQFEYSALINSTTYDNDSIVEFSIEDSVVSSDDLSLGAVISSRLNFTIRTADVIPTNAQITPYVKLLNGASSTENVPLGTYFIDNRSYQNGVWKFTCFDKLILSNQQFISALTYPETMQNVFNELIAQLNITLHSSAVVDPTFMVPYKDEDITIHDMLSYIAMANCCSVYLTRDNKLAFKKFTGGGQRVAIPPSEFFKCEQTNPVKTYTKIILTYNADGEILTAGTGDADHTMNIYNPFITQPMLNSILATLSTFSYAPVSMSWRGRPYLEIGDELAVTQRDATVVNTILLTSNMSFRGGMSATMTAPSMSAQRSEFDYQGSLKKLIKASSGGLQEDVPYYGVTIGRANGLKIEKSDGNSKLILNSDMLKWQVKVLGSMIDRLYFDAVAGDLKYNGKFGVEAIEAMKAEIDVVISNTTITNILTAGSANIAELTVDRLDTSDKVQNYLASNQADVNYIKAFDQVIEFVTATRTGATGTSQVVDRFNNPLYWLDDTFEGVGLEVTAYPVTVYNYIEQVKMKMEFVDVNGVYTPVMTFGVGSGVGDRMKGQIFKDVNGLSMAYQASNGDLRNVNLSEDGVTVSVENPNLIKPQVRNVHLSNVLGAPSVGSLNEGELWLVYESI